MATVHRHELTDRQVDNDSARSHLSEGVMGRPSKTDGGPFRLHVRIGRGALVQWTGRQHEGAQAGYGSAEEPRGIVVARAVVGDDVSEDDSPCLLGMVHDGAEPNALSEIDSDVTRSMT